MQTQSLAYQINNNNQATEARAPAYRLEQPKLSASDPHGDWQIYAVQVRTHIKMLGFNVDNTLTTAQEASLFGTLLNGVKDANLSYLVLNDNAEHRGSVAWLSLQHHFDSSSRAALTTQLNKFLASFYQPEQHPDFDRWLGGLMTQYERIMSIKDIKVSDVLLATCVNHLPNNAAWATFKNGLLAHDVMTKTQFYTALPTIVEHSPQRSSEPSRSQLSARSARNSRPPRPIARQSKHSDVKQPGQLKSASEARLRPASPLLPSRRFKSTHLRSSSSAASSSRPAAAAVAARRSAASSSSSESASRLQPAAGRVGEPSLRRVRSARLTWPLSAWRTCEQSDIEAHSDRVWR